MIRTMMKSKIHRATVTDADLNYEGSISIDSVLMEAANLYENEKVLVANVNNSERFETYVIRSEKSGCICLNGAAARLCCPGDLVIIISFAGYDEAELAAYQPKVVRVNAENIKL